MALSPSPSRLSTLSSVECNQISNAPPASLLFDFRAAEQSRRGKGWERVPLPSFAQKHKGHKVWKTWQYRDKRGLGELRSAGEESEEIEGESVVLACLKPRCGVELEDMTFRQYGGHRVETQTLDRNGRAGKKRRLTMTLPIGDGVWHATRSPAVACSLLQGSEADCNSTLGKSEISMTDETDIAPDVQSPSVDQMDSASQANHDHGVGRSTPEASDESVQHTPVFDAFLMPASAAARCLTSGAKRKHDEIDGDVSGHSSAPTGEKSQPQIEAAFNDSRAPDNDNSPFEEAGTSEPAASPLQFNFEVAVASPDEPSESHQLQDSCVKNVDEEGWVDDPICETADYVTEDDSIAHVTVTNNLITPSTPPPMEDSLNEPKSNANISPNRYELDLAETSAETECVSEGTHSGLDNDDLESEESRIEGPGHGVAFVARDDETSSSVDNDVQAGTVVAQPDPNDSGCLEASRDTVPAEKPAPCEDSVSCIHETQEHVQSDVTEPESGAILAEQPIRAAPSISSYLQDDTDMLKGFLDRVKAEKAAKAAAVTDGTEEVKSVNSPDSRAPLEDRDKNASSPRDGSDDKESTNKQKKRKKELPGPDAIGQEQDEAGTFRRSKRLRATDASKTLAVAPSLIPRFRPGGSEPLVLQKSAAQELSILTRLNTRRNKGRPCTTVLRAQSAERDPSADEVPCSSKKGKAVTWDEKLEYFQDEPKEARKKKASATANKRRINGTPARQCGVKAVERMACV